jgi:hypothetical protein
MSLKTIIIVILVIWLLNKITNSKSVENMRPDIKTVQTNLEDSQFILDNIDTAKRIFVQKEQPSDKKAFVTNLPLPAASFRSDICRSQFCASCDCYNPILMGMCKSECGIDPCDCSKGNC